MGIIKLNKKYGTIDNLAKSTESRVTISKDIVKNSTLLDAGNLLNQIAGNDDGFQKELKEKRTKNSIVYRRKDKTLKKIIFSVPQFYSENGEMKEIVNKLKDCKDEILNEANSFKISFSKNSADNKIFSLQEGDKTITLHMGEADSRSKVGCACKLSEYSENEVLTSIEDGVQIKYSVLNDRVKENIVINNKCESYEFLFTLDIEGLMAEEGEHNDILLKDECGTVRFIIPAPFMYDAAGVKSQSVYYEVEQSNNKLVIKVIADKEFINDESRALPVIIDPEIIISGSTVLECITETYLDSQGENDIEYNCLSLEKNPSGNYEKHASITVYKDNIAKINGAVEKVYLQLKSKQSANGFFKFEGVTYSARETTYTFDITEKYLEANTSFMLYLYAHVDGEEISKIDFETIGDAAPQLKITYLEEEDEVIEPSIKEFDVLKNTKSCVDLNNGMSFGIIQDFSSSDFSIPVSLYHVHSKGGEHTEYGTNWSLNINRKLLTATEDTEGTTRYLYVDEMGNKFIFTESYYYLANGERIYVAKNSVEIDSYGNMSFDGNEVYKQQKCLGNTLIAKLDDFIGVQYIEQRQSEQVELEEFLRSYYSNLKEYVVASRNDGTIIKDLSAMTKADCEGLLKAAYQNSLGVLMTRSEAMELQSLSKNYEYLGLQVYQYYIQAGADEDIWKDTSLSEEERNNAKERMDMERKFAECITEQRMLASAQKANLISAAERNFDNVQALFETYFEKKEQLETLLRHTPVNYLKDKNEIISGFNEDGNLVCIVDSQNNYIAISYDIDNLPLSMYDNRGFTITFNYENGKLVSLTDSLGRRVDYTYLSNNLNTVVFTDGVKVSLTYSSNLLSTITSSEGVKATYSYSSNKLTDIEIMSLPITIGKMITGNVDTYDEKIKSYKLLYNTNKTTVIDIESTSETYEFDSDGRLTIYNKIDNINNNTTINYSYSSSSEGKQITTISQQNYEDAVTKIEKYNLSDLIVLEMQDWVRVSSAVRKKSVTEFKYDKNDKLLEKILTSYIETNDVSKQTVSHKKYGYNAQGLIALTESYIEGEELTSGKIYSSYIYDEKGVLVKSVSWNSLDSSAKFYEENIYSEHGQIAAQLDETGEKIAEYEYVGSNFVNSIKYINGSTLAYGRDPYNFSVTSVTQSTDEGEANVNQIIYNNGLPVEVKSDNTVIDYYYDPKGRKTRVDINGIKQFECSYEDYSYNQSDEYAVYAKQTVSIDENTVIVTSKTGSLDEESGRIKVYENINVNGLQILEKSYDVDGRLKSVEDYVCGTTTYNYDDYDNITSVVNVKNSSTQFTEIYTYNDCAELTQKTITGEVEQTYTYSYKDTAARELDYVGYGTYKFYPLTDVNGRNTGREIVNGASKLAAEYITYRKVGDHATNMPATVWFGNGNTIKDSIKYKYDSCGNICEITQNGHLFARYKYDCLNRLVREDNKDLNKTTIYTYDPNGNIVERCEYAYTNKATDELSELECTHYYYDYDGDKLVGYNGTTIAYNSLGNPTTYRGNAITWQYGKRLTGYGSTTFTYNGQGRRISKNNITFTYDSNGNLLKQSNGLEFIYDNSGVIGVKYNNAQYFYRRDAQGNIAAILDSTGNVVVKYIYDGWGNHAIVAENGEDIESGIGVLNPFRYRGYYYDTETEIYFLQTRYYDPEVGRFISRDSIEYADPETINGLNLYAYCGNNPIMNVDPSGTSLIGFLIALAVSALVTSIVSNAVGEHFAAATASTVSGVQTIGTGISLLGFGPVGWVLGGIAILSGVVSLAFAAAEFQEHFTGGNYIKDGVGDSWYNGIYITNSFVSFAVTVGGTKYMNSSSGKLSHDIQKNAKFWDKGTFKTRYGSLKYHWSKHGTGITPGQYTEAALAFARDNASSFIYVFNYKYGNASWYFNNMFGVGGYYKSINKIITFWLR